MEPARREQPARPGPGPGTAVIVASDVRADPANLELLTRVAPDIRCLLVTDDPAELCEQAALVAAPLVGILHGDKMLSQVAATGQALARRKHPGGLIVAAAPGHPERVAQALWQGARGCVLTDSPVEELITAIRAVTAGHLFLPSAFLADLSETLLMLTFRQDALGWGIELTERELQVLRLLSLGMPNAEIGDRLFISEATVHTHVLSILRKLKARNRTEAVAMVYRRGFLHDSGAVAAAGR